MHEHVCAHMYTHTFGSGAAWADVTCEHYFVFEVILDKSIPGDPEVSACLLPCLHIIVPMG